MNTDLRSILVHRGLRLADFARLVGVNKSTATRWSQKRIPAERVLDVERVTGVSRHQLRPDLYPLPSQERAA